jgi:proton glutamate symport protein
MKNSMLIKVLIAIILAIGAGLITSPQSALLGISFLDIYGLIGQLFLNALSLVVVPLVSTSLIIGAARMGADHSFGSLGGKTLGFFVLTSFLAIMVGLLLAITIQPGQLSGTLQAIQLPANFTSLATQGHLFQNISQMILKVVPANIFVAASQGQMLGLIFFCLLFGFLTTRIEAHLATAVLAFCQGVFQIMMRMTQLVMLAMPIGVFGLVAKAVATTGVETMGQMAYFFLTVLLGLAVYALIVLPLLLKLFKVSPISHIKAMLPALVTAFSTSSSAATLPVTLECVEKRAGVSNRISSLVLPLGTSINISGSALYVCVGVLFIAQMYGLPLTLPSLVLVAFMTLLTSMGTPGIPSASLISVMMISQTLGIPAEGIGLIMAVERILDMFRTTVNVFGTSCCALLVAQTEGEKNLLPQAI